MKEEKKTQLVMLTHPICTKQVSYKEKEKKPSCGQVIKD